MTSTSRASRVSWGTSENDQSSHLPPHRIPEGQADAGSLAAGRLRSLEDQLSRAKQKIHSFQKLTGDGRRGKGGVQRLQGRIWHTAWKFESIKSAFDRLSLWPI